MADEEQKQSFVEQLLSAIGPSEAEAGPLWPIGKAFKAAARGVEKGAVSGTAKYLKGTEFKGGVIKDVTKGRGNLRYIILEDDTAYPVSKTAVSDLVRTAETKRRISGFKQLAGKYDIKMALNSMAYHEARSNPYQSKTAIRDAYKAYAKQMKEAGVTKAPYSLVERGGKMFTMPSEYAELLEKEGHVKIIEVLK